MKQAKMLMLVAIGIAAISLAGCGVPKDKYEAVLNDNIGLKEQVTVLTASREALKKEYDNLLKEKMDLATKVETLANEKIALKGEYDKILDEKVALKASYDKLQADSVRDMQIQALPPAQAQNDSAQPANQ